MIAHKDLLVIGVVAAVGLYYLLPHMKLLLSKFSIKFPDKGKKMAKIDDLSTGLQQFVAACNQDQLQKLVGLVGTVVPGQQKQLSELATALPPGLFQQFIAVLTLVVHAMGELQVLFPNVFGPTVPPAPAPAPKSTTESAAPEHHIV